MKRLFAFLIVAFYVSIALAAPAWFPEGIQTKGSSTIGEKSTAAASAVLDVRSTTKGMLPPRMTTSERNAIAAPATGLLVYDTDTKTFWQYNATSWIQVGSGGAGGRNYISANPDAEANTTGWVTYADAAGSTPVDGTGGSPTATWTRTTSTPLEKTGSFILTKDAANRQGNGVSFDFTIEREDRGRMLQIDYTYEIASGTFATGDLAWYIYDVTNARLIQPSAYQVENVTISSQAQPLQFQTSIDSTSYRLILHVATTSASAYTAKFDSVKVGPQNQANGPPLTSRQAYTPALTTSGGGSITLNATGKTDPNGFWWQEGDALVGEVTFRNGSGGAASGSAGTVRIGIPTGLVIDTAKMPTAVGGVRVNGDADVGTSTFTSANIYADSTTTLAIMPTGGSTYLQVSSLAANYYVAIKFKVPIVGWSSNTVVSSSANTRPVVFDAVNATSSHTSSATKMTGWTVALDSHGGWDAANNRYVVKVPGDYKITMSGAVQNTAFATSIFLYRNGSSSRKNSAYSNGSVYATPVVTGTLRLSAGDYIEGYYQTSSGVSTALDAAGNNYFSMVKIDGPSQISAETLIEASYVSDTGLSLSAAVAAIKPYEDRVTDTHSAYNTSTGVYTVPAPGRYLVIAGSCSGTTTYAVNDEFAIIFRKNSTALYRDAFFNTYAGPTVICARGSHIIDAVAGDTFDIQHFSDKATTGSTGNTRNHLHIVRMGSVN